MARHFGVEIDLAIEIVEKIYIYSYGRFPYADTIGGASCMPIATVPMAAIGEDAIYCGATRIPLRQSAAGPT